MRYFIELAYNGKNYHGWQVQQNAHSVQAEIESKLQVLLKSSTEITGCGRTDTGVHARQYFAHFESDKELDSGKFCYQLNALLPNDIAIYQLFKVPDRFHARFDALSRTYEYHISYRLNPFLQELSWCYYRQLDIQLMNQAADILKTYSDFECFSKVHTQVNTFICRIDEAKWIETQNGMYIFEIKADRFLRNMVRAIVGTMVEVGLHRCSLEDFRKILESKNRSEAGQSVPAQGLYLTKIEYPEL
ncbi:MAG: tRNA pseudouridine(38-40) synthase TruA [Bacteroidia bacterium]